MLQLSGARVAGIRLECLVLSAMTQRGENGFALDLPGGLLPGQGPSAC